MCRGWSPHNYMMANGGLKQRFVMQEGVLSKHMYGERGFGCKYVDVMMDQKLSKGKAVSKNVGLV